MRTLLKRSHSHAKWPLIGPQNACRVVHTHSQHTLTQPCTLCQLLTEHSGKSLQREQPLCEQERCSLLKRFTAVMLPGPFPPRHSSMVMLIHTSEWDKSPQNRRLAFCCNLTPIYATHWGDDISISQCFTSSLQPIVISKAPLNLHAALKVIMWSSRSLALICHLTDYSLFFHQESVFYAHFVP